MFSTCFLHMFSQFCTREICVFRLGELHLGGLLDLVHGAATSSVHPLERGCQVISCPLTLKSLFGYLGTWVPQNFVKLSEIHKIHMIKLEKGIENDNCRFGLKLSGT